MDTTVLASVLCVVCGSWIQLYWPLYCLWLIDTTVQASVLSVAHGYNCTGLCAVCCLWLMDTTVLASVLSVDHGYNCTGLSAVCGSGWRYGHNSNYCREHHSHSQRTVPGQWPRL
ncbi:hypothetical protein ACOMHN_019224 [Nucella lapillus]